jgi:hypothetical protein
MARMKAPALVRAADETSSPAFRDTAVDVSELRASEAGLAEKGQVKLIIAAHRPNVS